MSMIGGFTGAMLISIAMIRNHTIIIMTNFKETHSDNPFIVTTSFHLRELERIL